MLRSGLGIDEDVCGTGVFVDVVVEAMENKTKERREREKKERKVEEEGMLIYLLFPLLRQSHKALRLFRPPFWAKTCHIPRKSNNDTYKTG